jgi:medium-chain acyl-[acyl-carrier-protein] hydrolase
MIGKSIETGLWLSNASGVENPRLRVFGLPHAGGGASLFRRWPEDLPAGVEVLGIQLPGRENRWKESAISNMRELIERLVPFMEPLLSSPYVLFGHSMGAIVGFELAREFRRRSLPQPGHIFVSARRAPHLPEFRGRIAHLDEREFVALIHQRYGGIPQPVMHDPDLLRLFVPALRADIQLIETYRCPVEEPFSFPLTAFGGQQDTSVTVRQLNAWRSLSNGPFRLELFPGGHFFPQTAREAMLRSVLEDLRPLID